MDEVHMLSVGAVNAFLKTLEEPPKNVIFILATTDPQKLPITILSRCQRFDFKRINQKEISNRLKKITEAQNINYEQKSLDLISRVCDGALRDAVSILDQAIAMGENEIKYEDLVSILGLVTNEYLFDITDAVIDRNIEKAMLIVDKLMYAGKDMQLFMKDLIAHFRNLLMVKVTNNPEEVLDMSLENIAMVREQGRKVRVEEIMRAIRILQEAEINSKASKQSRLYLELAIIKMCKIEYDTSNEVILSRINKLEENLKSGKIQVVQSEGAEQAVNSINNTTKTVNSVKNKIPEVAVNSNRSKFEGNANSTLTLDDIGRAWTEIIEAFKAKRAMIVYASIVTAKPYSIKNGVVTLEYEATYAFNKQRLEKAEYREVVNSVFSEILKEKIIVEYIVRKDNEHKDNEQLLKQAIDGIPFEVYDE
jgi:DNA polymerase-3 subunit gamma/tau